jgi:hypothetical protein
MYTMALLTWKWDERFGVSHWLDWLGILIFGSNFWDPHWKWNSDSVFDSRDSGRIFFLIPMSQKSENWNSDLQNSESR